MVTTEPPPAATISGPNFPAATAVSFGSLPATAYVVNSATSITATSPAQVAPVDVTVTTAGGTSATSGADRFSYVFAPIRVNAGGSAYTDTAGNAWVADTGFSGGGTYSTSATIAGTSDQPLYDSERTAQSGAPFSYSFPVPNGAYTVTLKFADLYWSNPGQRTFDVAINGQQVLTNFDIIALVGPKTAVDKAFAVNVTGGSIAITFTSVVDNAKVDAIQIVAGTPPAPTVSGISPASGPTSGGTAVTISGTNFTAATAVSFGTTPAAQFIVNSATSITATAPAQAAGIMDITVSTAGGTSATSSADRFSYS